MISSISRFFKRSKGPKHANQDHDFAISDIRPETPFFAIGDVHGCVDLLARMLDRLDGLGQIVCVGDYINRGDKSAQVLELLSSRPDVICLRGNHEVMLLNFLKDPVQHGPRWLRYGGLQTLASFQIGNVSQSEEGLLDLQKRMNDALSNGLLDWLKNLPTQWQTGNVAVLHAGADPDLPISMQQDKHLLWGHDNFLTRHRTDGTWVVHGHTIVDAASVTGGRISIDTGAFATGRLSAAHIREGSVEFLVESYT